MALQNLILICYQVLAWDLTHHLLCYSNGNYSLICYINRNAAGYFMCNIISFEMGFYSYGRQDGDKSTVLLYNI